MLRQPVVADQVFQFNTMDKTLKDYIDRTQKRIKEENSKPLEPNPNQYPIFPEQKGEEDKPLNSYGQH